VVQFRPGWRRRGRWIGICLGLVGVDEPSASLWQERLWSTICNTRTGSCFEKKARHSNRLLVNTFSWSRTFRMTGTWLYSSTFIFTPKGVNAHREKQPDRASRQTNLCRYVEGQTKKHTLRLVTELTLQRHFIIATLECMLFCPQVVST